MTQPIRDLLDAGLHVLPIKFQAGKFIHPNYSDKFDTGFSEAEIGGLLSGGFNGAVAVIHGKCNPTLICLDFDEKNAPGKNLYDTWVNLIDPLVKQKLVIERTKSAGYHVYFMCKALPPEKALASSATQEEWIAARSARHNGITYCAPSPGYTELQGSLAYDLQELSREDMMQLCDAAAQLNEYTGQHTAKGTQMPILSVPQQFTHVIELFNRKVPLEFVEDLLSKEGWTTDGVVRKKGEWSYVKYWRPGRSVGQDVPSANLWIETRRLSVFTTSTCLPGFDSGMNFSHRPAEIIYYLLGRDWQAVYHNVLELCDQYGIALPDATPMTYFSMSGKTPVCKIEVQGILEWAEREGYCWMPITSAEESIVQLVKVVNNIVYEVDDKDLLRAFRNEVERVYEAGDASRRLLLNFQPSVMGYMASLPVFDRELMRDGVDVSYIYFTNGALKISKDTCELLKYSELQGCVFAKHIKHFDYREVGGWGSFGRFIDMICEDEDHKAYLMSSLGYIMHYHKLRNFAKALMLIEDVQDQEEARGRSGKGLLAQFVEWVRWVVQQDGRNYKSDSQFKMQRITPGVQVYYLNDPAPGVLMNQFYNFITDDWLVEAKGKKAYSIPYRHSPKLLITTNYLPNIESDSDKDRFIVVAIKKVFGARYAVRDAFPGVIFFDDHWDVEDALGAVRFAIDCIQLYLSEGVVSYENAKMIENQNKRVVANMVPGAIIESLEQAFECWKGAKNNDEFKVAVRVVDMRKDQPETMVGCFDWEPGGVWVYVARLYQYCLKGYNMRGVDDKKFGKKLRTYFDKMGYEVGEEVRNNATGRRVFIQLSSAIKSAIKSENAIKTGNNWDGVKNIDDTDIEEF